MADLHVPYLRRIDSCITQLKAQGPSRTWNESKEENKHSLDSGQEPTPCTIFFFFFFTLVTGSKRSLGLKLSDTRVYEPQIRAQLPISRSRTRRRIRTSTSPAVQATSSSWSRLMAATPRAMAPTPRARLATPPRTQVRFWPREPCAGVPCQS